MSARGFWIMGAMVIIAGASCNKRAALPAHEPSPGNIHEGARQPAEPSDVADARHEDHPRQQDPERARLVAVIQELLAAWGRWQNVSVDLTRESQGALGYDGDTKGRGHYDLSKAGGQTRIRFEMANDFKVQKTRTKSYHTAEMIQWLCDGEILQVWTRQYQRNDAKRTRYEPDAVLQIGGPDLFHQLRRERLELLPDESSGDVDVRVFASVPEEGGNRMLHHFDKATGIRIKWVELADDNSVLFKGELSHIETGVAFPPEHFTLQTPEGAEMIDEVD